MTSRSGHQSWAQWEWTSQHQIQDWPVGERQHRWPSDWMSIFCNLCQVNISTFKNQIWSQQKKSKNKKKMFLFNKHFLRNQMIYCVWLFTNMVLQCLLCFNFHVQVWRPELESVKVNCSTPSLGLTNCRKTTQVTSSSYSGVSAGSKP